MDDLDVANDLAVGPPPAAWFGASAPSYRRNVLRWIEIAKTPPVRAKRIATAAATSTENRKLPRM